MEGFVSDPEYDSSDEEDGYNASNNERGGLAGRYNDHNHLPAAEGLVAEEGVGYLNPLAKAKLVHLLARLPESNAKLRKGDVARVTAFAIEHAGAGGQEVVEMVCGNVVRPICCSSAARRATVSEEDEGVEKKEEDGGKKDTTQASMVGLYIISDILSSSSTSGVRHAWRYRSLFETALKKQKVFETLGRVDKVLGWGRLKAEKWKRSVHSILSLWEGWCVFPQASHEAFVDGFLNPPLSEAERKTQAREEQEVKKEEELRRTKSSSKWRSVEDGGSGTDTKLEKGEDEVMEDAEDLDGGPMVDDEDASTMSDIDGVPLEDSSDEELVQKEAQAQTRQDDPPADSVKEAIVQPPPAPQQNTSTPVKRLRPRAVDMFADESD